MNFNNATLDKNGWELENAVARWQENPNTFDIPSVQERNQIKIGSMVKLLFLLSGRDANGDYVQCERMWVTIEDVTANQYRGKLESLPQTSQALKPGDQITFSQDHIASILIRK